MEFDDERTAEIAGNLQALRDRIGEACRSAGRAPDEMTLIAVTKTYPAADVLRLLRLGVRDIGENRDQEASAKAAEVAAAASGAALPRWHYVGQLQRNKCRSVVRYAEVVHSVDSERLARALAEAAHREGRQRPLEVLVQVSLDEDPTRGGTPAALCPAVAEVVAADELLRLKGVMAVAPLDWEPEAAFAALAKVAAGMRASFPGADWISAGMSADLDVAIQHGSTHIRVGSALLGNRPTLG